MPLQSPRTIFVRHPWASLPRRHTGPGRPYRDMGRGYMDSCHGYMGGSPSDWTWSPETSISPRFSCRTPAWRQSSVPKPQAITQRQSPRREILSSSSSAPRSLCWRPSSGRAKNAAPHLQLLSSHLSVTAYIDHLVSCSMRHGVDIKPRFAGREWSRRR
jgi:hypothetical protein